jgi:hypothetical protein
MRKAAPLRLEYRTAAELADNPANWRRHPAQQTAALSDALNDVGWAGAVLYNERTKRLIDGHARKSLAKPDEKIPVLVGSWTPEQEAKILATLDPLGAMAQADTSKLAELLKGVTSDGHTLGALLDDMRGKSIAAAKAKEIEPVDARKPPEMVWCLIGIPMKHYAAAQKHVAALEAVKAVSVQVTHPTKKRY